jgi:isoleucyl-tRNA synthetase
MHAQCAGPYKDTVNLPQTKFAMRANSAQREPELQRFWEQQRVYETLLETNPGVRALADALISRTQLPPVCWLSAHAGHAERCMLLV